MNGFDSPNIIVASSDRDFLIAAQRELTAGGFDVHSAADGSEFNRLLSAGAELVVVDVAFPTEWRILLNGRSSLSNSRPATLVVSDRSSIADAVEAIKLGADDYCEKTSDWQALRDRCGDLIEEHRLQTYPRRDGRLESIGSVNGLETSRAPSSDDLLRTAIRRLIRQTAARNGDAITSLCVMEQIEKQAIIEAIAQAGGNVVAASKLLGVGQATVYRKIKRYGIELREKRARRRAEVAASS